MLQGTPGRRDMDQALAAFGITPAAAAQVGPHIEQQECPLWPEHATPVAIFQRMRGQWRMGFGGPVALDYAALPVVCRAMGLSARAQREAFEPLRVMEAEALVWFAEQAA